jgi:hypothetical protein
MNGVDYPQMVNAVRYVTTNFNIALFGIDAGGGGLALRDYLAQEWVDTRTGKKHPPLLEVGNPSHELMTGERVVYLYNFSLPFINEVYQLLRADLQHGRIQFPIHIGKNPDKKVEKISQNIYMTKVELQMLTPVPTSVGVKFEVPARFKMDRATALVLANKTRHDLEVIKLGQLPDMEFSGFWVREITYPGGAYV